MSEFIAALPTASLYDPEEASEGSIDPLGMYPLSEALALRIGSPGVRERQRNLRFLTICCVGWEVIGGVRAEAEPGDPNATLEQCLEWLVVEALAGDPDGEDDGKIQGLPGATKAKSCLDRGLHLNADRYLRMASVFGFFGVYRTLAEYIKLVVRGSEEGAILGDGGVRLLTAWRNEQGLPGFGRDLIGSGQKEYRCMVAALTKVWREGQVVEDRQAFQFIQRYLRHSVVTGKAEAAELRRLLIEPGASEADGNRREILKAVESKPAAAILSEDSPAAEARFHDLIRPDSSPNLKVILEAVRAYENFIGAMQNVFDDLLFALSDHANLIDVKVAAAKIPQLEKRAARFPILFKEATAALGRVPGLAERFGVLFGAFGVKSDAVGFLRLLLTHHERVQKDKPPEGKSPWIERKGDLIAVRLRYRRDAGGSDDGRYVYFYRSRPLFDLLESLKADDGKA